VKGSDNFFRVERFCVIGDDDGRTTLAHGANAVRNCTSKRLRHPAPFERASLSVFFPRELIDSASGAGSTLLAADLNKDGAVDIVTGNNLALLSSGVNRTRQPQNLETLIVCRSWAAD
jgi:hypothetical protein